MKLTKTLSVLRKHKHFLLLLSLGAVIRLFFISFPPFTSDMDSFIAWGEQVFRVGFGNFYSSDIWTDYAPGYFYFLWLIAGVKNLFFPEASRELYELLQKSVPVIFDLLTALILYRTLLQLPVTSVKLRRSIAYIISALYLFSPFTYFNGAIWGQVDSVFTFFLALSFYYFIKKNAPVACALYVVACVIKPQAAIVAPAYFVLLISSFSLYKKVISVCASVFTFYLLTVPFLGFNSLARLYGIMQKSVDTYPYGSINTFNFWGLYGFWQPDTSAYLFGITQQNFATFLVLLIAVVSSILFTFLQYKRIYEEKLLLFCIHSSLLVLLGIMFLTRMHERYLYPFFIYALLSLGLFILTKYRLSQHTSIAHIFTRKPIQLFIGTYVLLTIIHLVNLYYVYVYYIYFNVGVPQENSLFYAIQSSLISWSWLQLSLACVYTILVLFFSFHMRRIAKENEYETMVA